MKELLIRQAQLNAALDLDKNEMQVAPNLEARNLVASQLPINFQTARLLKSLRINGSSSLLVQNRGRRERQDASAKQFKSGSAIHLALQCLQSIDVTFDRTIAPALLDGRVHRTLILFQCADEALHLVDSRGRWPCSSRRAAS